VRPALCGWGGPALDGAVGGEKQARSHARPTYVNNGMMGLAPQLQSFKEA